MSKESLVFALGLVVFATPFVGIPHGWKEYIFIACGVMLMITGFLLRRAAFFRSIEKETGEHRADEFAESALQTEEKPPREETHKDVSV